MSIDTLLYSEKKEIEIIYTANYVLEEYKEDYSLTNKECIKVAEKARYYMDDYHISEYDAVPEAIKYYKYDERL